MKEVYEYLFACVKRNKMNSGLLLKFIEYFPDCFSALLCMILGFPWTTFVETAVYNSDHFRRKWPIETRKRLASWAPVEPATSRSARFALHTWKESPGNEAVLTDGKGRIKENGMKKRRVTGCHVRQAIYPFSHSVSPGRHAQCTLPKKMATGRFTFTHNS